MKNIITKIEIQKKNKNRVNVFLDHEFAFACSTEIVYFHGLEKNKKIDVHEIKNIVNEDNYIKGKTLALKFIEKSYKTEDQVTKKLIKAGYDEKVSLRVLNFLKEYKFVDDKRYASMFINEKSLSCGKNKMKYMLQKKGVSEEIIKNALENLDSSFEKKSAIKLGKKKYNTLSKSESDNYKICKKIGSYLASRGYDYSIVNYAIREIKGSEEFKEHKEKNECEILDEDEIKNEIEKLVQKRYKILCKSESDPVKRYRKLCEYVLRRGYKWEDVKKVLKASNI